MDKYKECSEWLDYAEMDLTASYILNRHYKKPVNIICYHCQQSAEKYLKAYLVSQAVYFEKTHDLLKIIKLCKEKDECFSEILDECIALNPYSIVTRYPSELELIDTDADIAINAAKKISEFVKSKIK